MAVTANWYGLNLQDQWGGSAGTKTPVNWVNDPIQVSLHTVTYVPNQDSDEFWTTPVTNEISGTGYTTKGVVLGSKTLTYDSPTHGTRMNAANAVWAASSFTARIAVVFKNTGTNATSPLMGFVNFGADQTVASGTFTIQWDATGVLKDLAS